MGKVMKHLALAGLMICALLAGVMNVSAAEPAAPQKLPANAPELKKDMVVMVVGSSVSVRRYKVHRLPKWTGGPNRVPPQCTNGQNVFFRVFEMLNDHENMRWRRLMDKDWTKQGEWKNFTKLPHSGGSPRNTYRTTDPEAWAELTIPAGYEKVDLIYTTSYLGGKLQVTIDGKAPKKNAIIDTYQERKIPADYKFGPELDTLDSHGKPKKIRRPKRGTTHIIDMRARYKLDKSKPHLLRVKRADKTPGKEIMFWGAVYWRGNCIQVVQRAVGGVNCGLLPSYPSIQEVVALKPDYLLMEAINIRGSAASVTKSFAPAFAWCGSQVKKGNFKMMVYSTCQASSKEFRKWFRVPANKPPYGAKDYKATCSDENCNACQQAVVDICKNYGFPLIDVGVVVDAYMAKNPTVKFVPHILNDWYHTNQWGAALFGQTIHDGIRKHWPELPIRPINMPKPPGSK
jgi:hypothetical protein